jgi:16S rRNA processing protein RimM
MGMADQGEIDKRVCVARIGAAHGVRGDVKLWSFMADPATIADVGPLLTADGRGIEILSLRPAKDFFVVRLKGVADRDAAERLRNVELFVRRDQLPPPSGADEFYYSDLIGLAAVDRAGARIGEVVAVHNFGAGDLIELRLASRRATVMLPFSEAVVPRIDVAGGTLVVEMPDGYLDDDGDDGGDAAQRERG